MKKEKKKEKKDKKKDKKKKKEKKEKRPPEHAPEQPSSPKPIMSYNRNFIHKQETEMMKNNKLQNKATVMSSLIFSPTKIHEIKISNLNQSIHQSIDHHERSFSRVNDTSNLIEEPRSASASALGPDYDHLEQAFKDTSNPMSSMDNSISTDSPKKKNRMGKVSGSFRLEKDDTEMHPVKRLTHEVHNPNKRHSSQLHLQTGDSSGMKIEIDNNSEHDIGKQINLISPTKRREHSPSSFQRLSESHQGEDNDTMKTSSHSSMSVELEPDNVAKKPLLRDRRRSQIGGNSDIIDKYGEALEKNQILQAFIARFQPELINELQESRKTEARQEKIQAKEKTLDIMKQNLLNQYQLALKKQTTNIYDDPMYEIKQERGNDRNIKQLQNYMRNEALKTNMQTDHWKNQIKKLKRDKKELAKQSRIISPETRQFYRSIFQSPDKIMAAVPHEPTWWELKKRRIRRFCRRIYRVRIHKKYLISIRNRRKEQWDVFILLMAFQNSFMVPFDLAFTPAFTRNAVYSVFDSLVETFFAIDIILQFLTTFQNGKGEEVFDSRQIFSRYAFSGRFIMDFLPLLGSSLFVNTFSQSLKPFGMIKITRMSRLSRMIAGLNLPKHIKALMKLLKLTLYLLLWFHTMACGWYLTISIHQLSQDSDGDMQRWVPPTDFLDNGDVTLLLEDPPVWSISRRYFFSLYYAILMIGNNELAPRNSQELLVGGLILLFSSVLNALIFSEMAIMLLNFQRKSMEYQIILDTSNHIMATINLPLPYQEDIRQFLKITSDTRNLQYEFDLFLDQLAPSLKIKVQNQIFANVLVKNPIVRMMIGAKDNPPSKSALESTKQFIMNKYNFRKQFGLNKQETIRIKTLSQMKQQKQPGLKKQGTRWRYQQRLKKSTQTSMSEFEMDSSFYSSAHEDSESSDGLPTHVQAQIKAPRSGVVARFMDEMQFTAMDLKEDFLRLLVSRLGTCLAMPEEYVVEQDDDQDGMYFIQKGDCAVNIVDQTGILHQAIKLLRVGEHFGEVAMMFKCRRTATVISMNYNNFAKLSYSSWREIVNEYPHFLTLLKHYYLSYNDERKKFLIRLIRRIGRFQDWLPSRYISDVIYRLKPCYYEKGSIILKKNSRANAILIIEYGEVKVVTKMEGHEFIIDYLYPGSVINLRSFFLEDKVAADIICHKNCKLLALDKSIVHDLITEHVAFERQFMLVQNTILKKKVKYPLDYEIVYPLVRIPRGISQVQFARYMQVRNKVKNVVFNIILEVRTFNSKPKLREVLEIYTHLYGKEQIKNKKEMIRKKLIQLYKTKEGKSQDYKFDRMMKAVGRISRTAEIKIKLFENLNNMILHLGQRRQMREKNDHMRLELIFERKLREVEKTFNFNRAVQRIRETDLQLEVQNLDDEEIKRKKTQAESNQNYLRVLKTMRRLDPSKPTDGSSSRRSSGSRGSRGSGRRGSKSSNYTSPRKKLANLEVNKMTEEPGGEMRRNINMMASVNANELMNLGLEKSEARLEHMSQIAKVAVKGERKDFGQFKSPWLKEKENIRRKIKQRIRYLRKSGWNLRMIRQEISEASEFVWTIDSDLEREAGHQGSPDVLDHESLSLDFEKVMQEINQSQNPSLNPRQSVLSDYGNSSAREKIQRSLDRDDSNALRMSYISRGSGLSSRRSSKLTNQQTMVMKSPRGDPRELMKEMELFHHKQ